jgi:hypothetical protein
MGVTSTHVEGLCPGPRHDLKPELRGVTGFANLSVPFRDTGYFSNRPAVSSERETIAISGMFYHKAERRQATKARLNTDYSGR